MNISSYQQSQVRKRKRHEKRLKRAVRKRRSIRGLAARVGV